MPMIPRGDDNEKVPNPQVQSTAEINRWAHDLTESIRYQRFHHPYACAFLKALQTYGVDGLYHPEEVDDPERCAELRGLYAQAIQGNVFEFLREYLPTNVVEQPWPIDKIEFESGGAFSQYNWELFFYIPMLIANRLSAAGDYEQAYRWYHAVFNPVRTVHANEVWIPDLAWVFPDDTTRSIVKGLTPNYWKSAWRFRPFLEIRSESWGFGPGADRQGFEETPREYFPGTPQWSRLVDLWREDPFDPNAIARVRLVSYQRYVFMKYLDNLIAWGDSEFRMDTLESINNALQLYMLALDLLGPRPVVPNLTFKTAAKTFGDLLNAPTQDKFGNAAVQIEALVMGRIAGSGGSVANPSGPSVWLFCTPPNDRLLEYWSTIEDRLFKIRNSLNIDGIFRSVSLFAPPIDPGLLVRAHAAGLSIRDVLSGLFAPPPPRRFSELHRRAIELSGDVRGLASALLSALEKEDAETLIAMRQSHEVAVQDAVRDVRVQQLAEAKKQIDVANASVALASKRESYYKGLVDGDLIAEERDGQKLLEQANQAEDGVAAMAVTAAIMTAVGLIYMPGAGPGPVGQGMSVGIEALRADAGHKTRKASLVGTSGGYRRRKLEWKQQQDLAKLEKGQAGKSVEAATLRADIATKELSNHDLQITQSKQVTTFLEQKYTNAQLYSWMGTELRSLHSRSLDLALDMARQAEAAYRFERGDDVPSFISTGYDGGTYGDLVAADRLLHDLQRMGSSYVKTVVREFEMTKHVSLADLDPFAVVALRELGHCFFTVPEVLFDIDAPGTYFRRLKSVEVSIPCSPGTYASVPAKVTLVSSSIRYSNRMGTQYEQGSSDDRFREGARAPVSITTSHGRKDTGTFDGGAGDKLGPFEGEGTVGDWAIELPGGVRPFDYQTIADVVLTLHFTCRDGGTQLREAASASVLSRLQATQRSTVSETDGSLFWFSAARQFPTEWAAFQAAFDAASIASFDVLDEPLRGDFPAGSTGDDAFTAARDAYLSPSMSVVGFEFEIGESLLPPGAAAEATRIEIVSFGSSAASNTIAACTISGGTPVAALRGAGGLAWNDDLNRPLARVALAGSTSVANKWKLLIRKTEATTTAPETHAASILGDDLLIAFLLPSAV